MCPRTRRDCPSSNFPHYARNLNTGRSNEDKAVRKRAGRRPEALARGLLISPGEGGRWMTFKLESSSDGERWVVRMIGAAKSERLGEISIGR
jgi:hypothetical protein